MTETPKSEFNWNTAAMWATMSKRELTKDEADLLKADARWSHIRKLISFAISALPGIILALQQLLVAIGA